MEFKSSSLVSNILGINSSTEAMEISISGAMEIVLVAMFGKVVFVKIQP